MARVLALLSLINFSLQAGQISDALREELQRSPTAHALVLLSNSEAARRMSSLQVTYRWRVLPGFSAVLDAETVSRLAEDPDIAAIDLDLAGGANLVESRALVGADPVYQLGHTGAGVTVAVLDTGVDLSHPDLRDRIVGEHCFCRNADGTGCCLNGAIEQGGTGSARDQNGHGTNVAGIIASQGTVAPRGVAPGVKLVAVRVLDRQGRFSGTSQILSALDWIAANHPEVQLVNLSLGTDARFAGHCDVQSGAARAFAIAVGILNARGVTVVASTGNSASPLDVQLPACIGRVLSVGAVYDSDVGSVTRFTCTDATTGPDRVACFSNSSSAVDLLAPGAPITATGMGGHTSTYYGTSMASPHVVGSAAILLEIDSRLSPETIELLLEGTGRPVMDARNGLIIPRLDMFAALSEVRREPGTRRRSGRK